MQVLVTLNSGQGGNLGPNFTLSANTGIVTPNTATLTQLLAGIYVTVDNAAISVTITSVGTCTNSLVLNLYSTTTIAPTTSTTTTAPTTTTTASPVVKISTDYTILCGGGGNIVSDIIYGNGTNICNSSNVASITFYTLYAGTYYLYSALLGYVEYYKISGVGSSLMNRVGACISCPTTTTTTTTAAPTTTTTAAPTTTTTAAPTTTTTTTTAAPTTSTTTSPEGFCYTANRYECIGGSCVFVEALNINNPVELNIPRYYFDSVNGYVFRIEELITCAGGYLVTNMSGAGALSCNTLCPEAPTTTTTTTEAPTTTTTTTEAPTTTAAPTTSTTTSLEGFCYTANRYECIGGSCVFVEALNINNPVELNIPRYYFDSVNGYVFRIEELITCAGGYLVTNMSGAGTLSCNTLCP